MADLPVKPLPRADYDAIENAVMETERGRWFLKEHRARNRIADTKLLLKALKKIAEKVDRKSESTEVSTNQQQIQLSVAEMIEAIERTKREIAEIDQTAGENGTHNATAELDAIVTQTEKATGEILNAAEQIQELAWNLREAGAADEICDKIDAHATDIFMSCSFQDLTGQRTQKVVQVLRFLENRVHAMMDVWGMKAEEEAPADNTSINDMDSRPDSHLLNGPQLDGNGHSQNDIDNMIGGEIDFDAIDVGDNATAETIDGDAEEVSIDASEADIEDIAFDTIADDEDADELVESTEVEVLDEDPMPEESEELNAEAIADATSDELVEHDDDVVAENDIIKTDDILDVAEADSDEPAVEDEASLDEADDEAHQIVDLDEDLFEPQLDAEPEEAAEPLTSDDEAALDDAFIEEMNDVGEDTCEGETEAVANQSDEVDPTDRLSDGQKIALFS